MYGYQANEMLPAFNCAGLTNSAKSAPDRRDVWDGFERTDTVTAYPMVENHDTEQRRRLVVVSDKYLAPLAKARAGRHLKSVAQLWPKAGRLLVAERLRLDTTRVVAMRSGTNVLSNVWWPIRVQDEPTEKGSRGLAELQLGTVDYPDAKDQHRRWLGGHKESRPGRVAGIGHTSPLSGTTPRASPACSMIWPRRSSIDCPGWLPALLGSHWTKAYPESWVSQT